MAPGHKRHSLTLSNGTKISIVEGMGSIYLVMDEVNLEKGKVGSKVFAQITPWRVGLNPDGLTREEWSRLMQPKEFWNLTSTSAVTCSICYVAFPCISDITSLYTKTKQDNGELCSVCGLRVCEACTDNSRLSEYPKPPIVCKLCSEASRHKFVRRDKVENMITSEDDIRIAEQITAIDALNKEIKD